MALLEARGITKIFGKLTALEWRRTHGCRKRISWPDRTERLRQEHADEMRRRRRGAHRRHGNALAATISRKLVAAERARAGMSLKFQITSVLPALTLYDNILLALQAQTSLPEPAVLPDARHPA